MEKTGVLRRHHFGKSVAYRTPFFVVVVECRFGWRIPDEVPLDLRRVSHFRRDTITKKRRNKIEIFENKNSVTYRVRPEMST